MCMTSLTSNSKIFSLHNFVETDENASKLCIRPFLHKLTKICYKGMGEVLASGPFKNLVSHTGQKNCIAYETMVSGMVWFDNGLWKVKTEILVFMKTLLSSLVFP